MVALVRLVPDKYVNVSIQFAMICRIESPYVSMSWNVDVCVLTRHVPILSNRRYFGPTGSKAVQNGTKCIIALLYVNC